MSIYFKSITLNEFDGALQQVVIFNNGLNIISGENGTGKTTVIKKIKECATNNIQQLLFDSDDQEITSLNQISIYALSPKRNSEKQNIEQIFNKLRTQNKTINTFLDEIKNKQINDKTFESYPSFGELFLLHYDLKKKDGGEQISKMNSTTEEFNEVLKQVFPEYEIISEWNQKTGEPDVKLKISNRNPLSLDKLSCGQQEVLSLLFNIYISKDKYQIYLIDEPEIHLNWNLEKGLFNFFDWFCSKYNKQIIVITHSRVIFEELFYSKTKFLTWQGDKIIVSNDVTKNQKNAIVGELASAIQTIAPSLKTFFLEDSMQELIIKEISNQFKKEINTVICGNSENVKTFFKLSCNKTEAWKDNSYYLIDGDGQGNPYPSKNNFIHLDKYCIECYLFDFELLANVLNKDINIIKNDILEIIKKTDIFSKTKYSKIGRILIENANIQNINEELMSSLDCSQILDAFLSKNQIKRKEFVANYINCSYKSDSLNKVFGEKLITAINR